MEFSKHNIFSKITDSDEYFLINPLYQQADILTPEEAEKYINKDIINSKDYIDKGYVVDPKEEDKFFKKEYLKFIDERDTDEIQLFFTPWYTCNFNCSYCFQDEYTNPDDNVDDIVIDAFFNYIDNTFAGRRKYITIFGGEPFLNTPAKKASIKKIIDGANKRNLDIAVVTNGYHIVDFIDILKTAKVREIQVTLDGTEHTHDSRRMLKGGQGSFSQIEKGIDLLLKNNMSVNVRVIIDKDNINNLTELADFAIKKGWTKSVFFKTALGRNYELHHCQTNNSRLFNRIEMYKEVYKLVKKHPQILEFHKPAFSIAKFIFENGELPNPLFDSCSGTKTEWAFDYSGRIYSCTATVGNIGDELGTFYPKIELNEELIEEWEERDVLSIKECSQCSVRLACGGGCAAIAKSQTGKLHSPDCRPIKELLELGISLYNN
jgi:uncharacterized protein